MKVRNPLLASCGWKSMKTLRLVFECVKALLFVLGVEFRCLWLLALRCTCLTLQTKILSFLCHEGWKLGIEGSVLHKIRPVPEMAGILSAKLCDFAPEGLLDRAQSKKSASRFSLLDGIVAFWRATEGPNNRKAYLPFRKVKVKTKKKAQAQTLFSKQEACCSYEHCFDILAHWYG